MGTWGTGILSNDTSAGIHDDYIRLLNQGKSRAAAMKAVRAEHALEFKDRDTTEDAWVAVALAQWEFGMLDPAVFRRVSYLAVRRPAGLWKTAKASDIRKRSKVMEAFVTKLRTPCQRPKKVKAPLPAMAAPFSVGDCIAIRLSDGTWGAAIVTGEGADELLRSERKVLLRVIAQLDYHAKAKPDAKVFEKRKWLRLTHSGWGGLRAVWNIDGRGFKAAQSKFEVMANVPIRKSDPTETDFFSDWTFGEQIVLESKAKRTNAQSKLRR